jgi:hypothetical protein
VLNPIGAASALVGASSSTSGTHESVLQQALDTLVGKGTITQTQANAVTNQVHSLEQQHPHGFGPGMRSFGAMGAGLMGDFKDLTTLLKTDPKTLFQDIRSGKSIADIAKANGVNLTTVEQALIKDATDGLNQAVKNGWLTQAKATALESKLSSEIATMVNQKYDFGALGMGRGFAHPGFAPGGPGAPATTPAKPGSGSTTTTTH